LASLPTAKVRETANGYASWQAALFRFLALVANAVAIMSVGLLLYGSVWTYATAQYTAGFADSIVTANETAYQKCEALLKWVAHTPPSIRACFYAAHRSPFRILPESHGPYDCRSYTNAFVKLATASGIGSRSVIPLGSAEMTKHVLAEVWLDDHWVIVDPTFGAFFIDRDGRLLSKSDLRDPAAFEAAIANIPGYEAEDDFSHATHIHLELLPVFGHQLRRALDYVNPAWDDAADWGYLPDHPALWPILASLILFPLGVAARMLISSYDRKRLRATPRPFYERLYGAAHVLMGETDGQKMAYHR
jgi:hypothetical protein